MWGKYEEIHRAVEFLNILRKDIGIKKSEGVAEELVLKIFIEVCVNQMTWGGY